MTDVIAGVVVTLVLLILIILVVILLTLFLLKRRAAMKGSKVASTTGANDFNNPNYEVGEFNLQTLQDIQVICNRLMN